MQEAMTSEGPAAPPSHRGVLVRLFFGLLLFGVLSLWLLRGVEGGKLLAVLRQANLYFLLLAIMVDLTLNITAFVQRFRVLLHAFPTARRERFVDVLGLSLACYATGVLVPGQPGLLIRTLVMHRRYGYQYADLITAQVVEKVIEVLSLSILGWVALWGRPAGVLAGALWGLAVGAPAGAAVLWLAARWAQRRQAPAREAPGRLLKAVLRVGESLDHLHEPSRLLSAGAWSLGSHLCGTLALGLCLMGLGLPSELPNWFLLYLVVNLALIMPVTPGQLGVVEAGLVAVLALQGISREPALAFALVYHAVLVLPTTLVGLVILPFLWPLMGRNRSR